jgi:uncharacterized protein (TIGR03084 family)
MSPAPSVAGLCADLSAEHRALDVVVAALPVESWAAVTPAAGWDVRDSISHLCFFDEAAALALTDASAFEAHRERLIAAKVAGANPDVELGRDGSPDPATLLARWRTARSEFLSAAEEAASRDPSRRVPWYGPPMSIASFTTARIMETWAHGQDVRDAVGAPPEVSPRLRHVIHVGVAARPFAFAVHGAADPGDPIRVEAAPPDGGPLWTWGPEDAVDRVTGPALDLALVLTQRRHVARTEVTVEGPTARAWIAVAQAFAGPPTTTAPGR